MRSRIAATVVLGLLSLAGCAGTPNGDGPSPAATTEACPGLDTSQPWVTDDTITIGNASETSGPIGDIFGSAQQAVTAYVAYFNETSDLCGRDLALQAVDTGTDEADDEAAYTDFCESSLAAVGSLSRADAGGAFPVVSCNLPDLRVASLSEQRVSCAICFPLIGEAPPGDVATYFRDQDPKAARRAALVYLDVPDAETYVDAVRASYEAVGLRLVVDRSIALGDSDDLARAAQEIEASGAELVSFPGAPLASTADLQRALDEIGYAPRIFLADGATVQRDPSTSTESLTDGTYVASTTASLTSDLEEMHLYRTWLEKTSPGAEPTPYGIYAWSAARLFTETAQDLGGELTREVLTGSWNTLADWTDHDMHGPTATGSKAGTSCFTILQVEGAEWTDVSGSGFSCGVGTSS